MDSNLRQTFIALCQDAYDLDRATNDIRAIEPLLVQILTLVKQHPEQRELCISLFADIMDERIASPDDVVPFCMRELRFLEIRTKALAEASQVFKEERSTRRMNYISRIMHAFDAVVWEEADMWAYYAEK